MNRPRDRKSAVGLLPRMEAMPWKSKPGTVTYRFHPVGQKPISLGTDKALAIRKVLDMNRRTSDFGTVTELWRTYQTSPDWKSLKPRTKLDYTDYSVPLLKVFGASMAGEIKPPYINRYLRTERAAAPVRANREIALLSNLMNLAVERGDIDANPCKQIRRNKEEPRTTMPKAEVLTAFLTWLRGRGKQWIIIAAMAEFAARAGSRRAEFLKATLFQMTETEIRLERAKQRGKAVVFDVIALTPELYEMLASLPRKEGHTALFQNRFGNAYAEKGFKAMWSKAMRSAIVDGILTAEARFTFHDLRAYYTTRHQTEREVLPNLHVNPATTARIYERSGIKKRGSF